MKPIRASLDRMLASLLSSSGAACGVEGSAAEVMSTTSSATIDMESIKGLMSRFLPSPTEPILVFEGSADVLMAEVARERHRCNPGGYLSEMPGDPFGGLEVVEEEGVTFIGTAAQLAVQRRRWGSLTIAYAVTKASGGKASS